MNEKKFYILGTGINPYKHITLETIDILKTVQKILILPHLPTQVIHKFHEFGISNIENLSPLYVSGDVDVKNYQRVYDYIMETYKSHEKSCLLIPGHPRIGVTLVNWLETRKDIPAENIYINSGISSFDTMINDLKIDPIERGSIILDANRLLLFQYNIDPCLHIFIYHVCSIGTAKVHLRNPENENKINSLKNYLLQYYPEDHETHLLSSQTNDDQEEIRHSVKIKDLDLEKLISCVHFGTSLYIPPLNPKRIDYNFLKTIQVSQECQIS